MMSDDMQDPILYMLTGLPFSGKSTLAKQLAEALQMKVLSYDHNIYEHYKDTVPAGTSKAEEFDRVQAIAREHLRALLERGESVIYDDLNLEESDRQRSEEHTSELQSHLNLVCRLLLEKKKNTRNSDVSAREAEGAQKTGGNAQRRIIWSEGDCASRSAHDRRDLLRYLQSERASRHQYA